MKKARGFSKVYYFVSLLILVMIGGTVGYIMIEGYEPVDAFYMTIITISTVGFREVVELSLYGKLFTAFLIIFSFGTFAYAVTSLTTYVVGGEYKKHLKEIRMLQQLKRMKDHVIITGYGRVGKQVAEDLRAIGCEFVIIESDEAMAHAAEDDGFQVMIGDSTNDDLLKMASIETAKGIITCLPKDADNTYVVLSARELSKGAIIISRASSPSAVSKLKMAGANNVIMPGAVGGSHMASLIAHPDIIEFLDMIRVKGYQGANVQSICYDDLPEEYRGKTIGELEARRITGVTIIGFKKQNGEYVINPPLEQKVTTGSRLFVLGTTDQIEKLVAYFNLPNS